MFNKILMSIREKTFLEKVKNHINGLIKKIYISYIRKREKIIDNKIIFLTYQGKYSCNPKAIAEELIEENTNYDLVWAIKKEDKNDVDKYPSKLRLVLRGSFKFYRELASSKYIIENANDTLYLHYKKRQSQVYIQTWHGSLGFKRLDTVKNAKWTNIAKHLGEETDYCISNSKFETEVFRTSYWKKNTILEYGHPRNDILLNEKKYNEINKKVRKYYNIDENTKIILYAPTFRDEFTMETYNIDIKRILKAFEKKFKCKCVFMLRMHYKLRNIAIPKNISSQVVNATDYYDMQDLLCAADFGITDYSSWMCDFVLTDKPGFLYIYDYEKYVDERGFYYPLSSTPFPLAKTNDEFIKNIENFDKKKYQKDRVKFLNDRGCEEKGNASKRVVKLIKKCN